VKIACFLPAFPVLSETFILNRITGLIERGHQVDLFAERSGDLHITHADVRHFRLLERTQFWNVPRTITRRVVKGLRAALANVFTRPRLVLNSLNYPRYGLAAASLVPLLAGTRLRQRREYDVLYCHFGPTGLIVTALRDLGLLEGKIATAFYGYDLTMIPKRFGPGVYERLFRWGDLFLPLCHGFHRRLAEMGCDAATNIVHPIGVDCNRYTFSPRQPPADGPIRIVTIARMVEKKGLEYGLHALQRVAGRCSNLEYVIIGDGPRRARIERLVDELNLRRLVRFEGWMPQQRVVKTLAQSHLLLAPSVTAGDGDQEGTPMVIMEAAATGMPVISTLHSGIPEIVRDGVSGYLVPERDVEALADRLAALLEHPQRWENMGRAGRRIVEERFNIDTLNDELVDLFKRLCHSNESRPDPRAQSPRVATQNQKPL